jgi:hypothetical protein
MKSIVLTTALLGLAASSAFAAPADDAIALVEQYWEARNDADYEAQYRMMSAEGTLGANSNGTFFTNDERGTLEELEEDMSNIASSEVEVRYPEAYELSDSVILVRYYLEGPIEFANGTRQPNYRTRVTHILVQEDGGWKTRSWHFSPLHNGGVFAD